jgi:L-lactate dehydrogenase complex protein LldE
MSTENRPSAQKIYFFATCLVDLYYPRVGLAAIELLQREGLEIVYPADQGCCGQPAFNSGFRGEALAVARKQLALFRQQLPVVVPSASCAGMIRNHWPELFAGQPDLQQALDVAGRTYELTEYLSGVLNISLSDIGQPVEITVHSSCSALRDMQVAVHINKLLGQLAKVSIREQAHKTECCGFGGTFAVKQPDISGAMVTAKCDALEATGAGLVVSQDCGCLMNIGGAFDKRNSPVKTTHIAEFLLERSS